MPYYKEVHACKSLAINFCSNVFLGGVGGGGGGEEEGATLLPEYFIYLENCKKSMAILLPVLQKRKTPLLASLCALPDHASHIDCE